MEVSLDRWKRGDRFSAGHLNQSVDVLRSLTHIGTNGKVSITRIPTGTALSINDQVDTVGFRLGKIISTPTGKTNYTDERYWVNFEYIAAGLAHDQLTLYDDPPPKDDSGTYMDEYPIVASNISEIPAHSHSLATGTPVLLFAKLDRGSNPTAVTRWFFISGATNLPQGQYQYMTYQMVAQNQPGWDFTRAHPLI